jgi:hypothetical protein
MSFFDTVLQLQRRTPQPYMYQFAAKPRCAEDILFRRRVRARVVQRAVLYPSLPEPVRLQKLEETGRRTEARHLGIRIPANENLTCKRVQHTRLRYRQSWFGRLTRRVIRVLTPIPEFPIAGFRFKCSCGPGAFAWLFLRLFHPLFVARVVK